MSEFIKMNADGNAVITLAKAITIANVKVTAITMREPTVKDQLVMNAGEGNDADKELSLFGQLTGYAPDDLHALSLRDYKRLQKAFELFID